jgi:hypothetical protein
MDLPNEDQKFPLHSNNNNDDENQRASIVAEANYHSRSTVFSIKRCVQRLIFRPPLLHNQPHHKPIFLTLNKSVNIKPEIIGCAYLPCSSMPIELTRLSEIQQSASQEFPYVCGTREFIALLTRPYLFFVFIA